MLNKTMTPAFLLLTSLKPISQSIVISAILVCVLGIFTAIGSALYEVTTAVSHLWGSSDSITRLLLLCLAIYIVRKTFPYIIALHARGVL